MRLFENDNIYKNKMRRMSDINDNFSKFLVVIVRIIIFNLVFDFIFFYFFYFFCIFIFTFVFIVFIAFVATILFDSFTNFMFNCKFEMFYVTIVDVVIKNFTFITSFNFLNDCHDVIFNDIISKKFVEIDNQINNQINNQKNKHVIVNDKNFKKNCILSFVNVNNIQNNKFEFIITIIIEEFVFWDSTINERTSAFWKICQTLVDKSNFIHFWIEWVNDKFVNNVSKLNVIIIDNKTFKDFDNFEFDINEHESIETFELTNLNNFFQIVFAIMRFLLSW